MQIAILIYKYFPFGGLQRDMRSTVKELLRRGHQCRIYCGSWEGEPLKGVRIHRVAISGRSNHARNESFQREVARELAKQPADIVFGFDKMPGLDLYFAGETCFLESSAQRSRFYQRGGRFKHFSHSEKAVFSPDARTRVLLLSEQQRADFVRHYDTPDSRMTLLPPGVARNRRAQDNVQTGLPNRASSERQTIRQELGLQEQELSLLFVGSAFVTKGLDRVIETLAQMAQEQPSVSTRLLVVGTGKPRRYVRQAKKLGVGEQVTFLGGREDVAHLMLAADVLVHPARSEAAGVVLLEALVAGLPVVTVENCGYAAQIKQADAGIVLPQPFSQEQLNRAVMRLIDGIYRADCRESALRYANLNDLYSMHSVVADAVEATAQQMRSS